MTRVPPSPDEPLAATMIRDAAALITSVDDAMIDVLGWRPDQLVGRPSTRFIHPEDQGSAIAAWFEMITSPGETRTWRGRYQAANGAWRWVESVNHNCLDDPDNPVVSSVMTLITVDEVGVEEELRARKQLLSRLSDALPVGLFQIDANRRITFTNDRLHTIVGSPPAATVDAQFSRVADEDRSLFDGAIAAVLADQAVDDIDIRFRPSSSRHGPGCGEQRVCVLAIRALTDGSGSVNGAIGCLSDITDRVRLSRELSLRASIDQLTSCLNRSAILDLLAATLCNPAAERGTAVVFIDLDHFKTVNDRHGHAAGDRLLRIAAKRLFVSIGDDDRIGRIGGDEFLVVCPAVESASAALLIGLRLAEAMTASVDVGGRMVELRASVGVCWTSEPLDPDTMVARADNAMYVSKRAGLSSATLFEQTEREIAHV